MSDIDVVSSITNERGEEWQSIRCLADGALLLTSESCLACVAPDLRSVRWTWRTRNARYAGDGSNPIYSVHQGSSRPDRILVQSLDLDVLDTRNGGECARIASRKAWSIMVLPGGTVVETSIDGEHFHVSRTLLNLELAELHTSRICDDHTEATTPDYPLRDGRSVCVSLSGRVSLLSADGRSEGRMTASLNAEFAEVVHANDDGVVLVRFENEQVDKYGMFVWDPETHRSYQLPFQDVLSVADLNDGSFIATTGTELFAFDRAGRVRLRLDEPLGAILAVRPGAVVGVPTAHPELIGRAGAKARFQQTHFNAVPVFDTTTGALIHRVETLTGVPADLGRLVYEAPEGRTRWMAVVGSDGAAFLDLDSLRVVSRASSEAVRRMDFRARWRRLHCVCAHGIVSVTESGSMRLLPRA